MSASETSREDRQLPATERRIQQAREEGQLVRSHDLTHFLAMGMLVGMLLMIGPWMAREALQGVGAALRIDRAAAFDTGAMGIRLGRQTWDGLWLALPVLSGMVLALVAANIAIGGWNFTTKPLVPKFSALNPANGLSRIFALKSLAQHLKLVLTVSLLLGVAAQYVWTEAPSISRLFSMPLEPALQLGFGWITSGFTGLLVVVFLAALIDVPLQIFKHHADLRMTLEEVKQENKESDGDPHIKGERRRKQREMSRGRMLAAVPTADVVVTNPTHYAVALKYDEATMSAPRIVAMGADHLALKIREIASASSVTMLESAPLARALYKHGDLDREIPAALYTAVAQLLAYVFQLRREVRMPPLPQIEVPAGLDPLHPAARAS